MIQKLKLLALAIPLAFSACATVSPEMRSAYDKTQQTLANQPVAIISDGCLIRVELGKDDILYQQSDLASVALAQTVKSRLTQKGVQVNHISSPFICGTYDKQALTKLDILVTHDGKDQLNTDYPILSSSNHFDGVTNQAYLDLYSAIDSVGKTAVKAKGTYTKLGLSAKSRDTIRQIEGADKVFVTMVSGTKPSFGATMTVGAATALISGGTYTSTLQSGQFYTIYLINLATDQVEWGKTGQLTGRVFKMPVDSTLGSKKMLEPLYTE